MSEPKPTYQTRGAQTTFTCPHCGAAITASAPLAGPFRIEVTCPACHERVTFERQRQITPAAVERKDGGVVFLRSPEGRFMGEFDPARMTVTLPYRGEYIEFTLGK